MGAVEADSAHRRHALPLDSGGSGGSPSALLSTSPPRETIPAGRDTVRRRPLPEECAAGSANHLAYARASDRHEEVLKLELSATDRSALLVEVVRRIERAHGAPDHVARDPLETLVACVLSQHTSDVLAARARDALRARWPSWEELAAATPAEVAEAIWTGGLGSTKAGRIAECLRQVSRREGAYSLERLRRMTDSEADCYLRSLPGVGPKTSAIVLCFALNRDRVPVDTHVHRVSRRLGLIGTRTTAAAAHNDLNLLTPCGMAYRAHVALIRLGRTTCRARRALCDACVLSDRCSSAPDSARADREPA